MPKRTNPFQQITASIMATTKGSKYGVRESVLVANDDTGSVRELDIIVYDKQDKEDIILVECRDHSRKQDVQWIDELDGKARSLGIKRVIAVSSSGFYKPAENEAKRRGIETLTIKEAEEKDWREWMFSINEFSLNFEFPNPVPVVKKIEFVTPLGIKQPSFDGATKDNIMIINKCTGKKGPICNLVTSSLNNPETIKAISKQKKDTFSLTVRLDHGDFYAVYKSDSIPIKAVKIYTVLVKDQTFKAPLKHYNVGQKKIHVADFGCVGLNKRVVLEEVKDGTTNVMVEETEPLPKK